MATEVVGGVGGVRVGVGVRVKGREGRWEGRRRGVQTVERPGAHLTCTNSSGSTGCQRYQSLACDTHRIDQLQDEEKGRVVQPPHPPAAHIL